MATNHHHFQCVRRHGGCDTQSRCTPSQEAQAHGKSPFIHINRPENQFEPEWQSVGERLQGKTPDGLQGNYPTSVSASIRN